MVASHSPILSVCLTGRNWSADGSSFQRCSWVIRDHLCFMFCLFCPLRVISGQTMAGQNPPFVRYAPKSGHSAATAPRPVTLLKSDIDCCNQPYRTARNGSPVAKFTQWISVGNVSQNPSKASRLLLGKHDRIYPDDFPRSYLGNFLSAAAISPTVGAPYDLATFAGACPVIASDTFSEIPTRSAICLNV